MVFKEVSVKVDGGGLGRGLAVREYIAVGPICSISVSQMSRRVNPPCIQVLLTFP